MKNIVTINLSRERVIAELISYGWVFFGSFILSIAYVLFIIPHSLVPGGILGLSIVTNELTSLSIGMVALAVNIPLLLWGTKVLGRKVGIKTAFSMILVSLFIDLFSIVTNGKIYIDDVLVSSLFGGVIIGVAVAIVMNAGATTGGNDILVRIIATKIKLPYSQLILVIDGAVILLGIFVFEDFTMAAYSIIAIIAISKTIDYYIKKSVQNRTVFVFSSKNLLIQEALLMNENSTDSILKLIHHDSNDKLILITKNNKKIAPLEGLIYSIDPHATITVLESNSN
ncbi:YitT family protein [Ulvibacter litoralis]|uniref:Uncharacterized membrane-anchored protein YitT, contains DUF161 and DUF2179 domains n=1 Tax=Ulvibacter litoralis TaxID=227084 RepID=A0A1G7ER14_9FLAO|nr:YitT family protein [Ulvibacter litoralis]GHC54216.1 UPF0750 membrane protein YpjC [Ulvibacter litoralis]SDE66102.1 Uncharacterized membrane-anchored protein YitT, contains DUF161 and DUF2179 domains [Ulvibacter litoralis]